MRVSDALDNRTRFPVIAAALALVGIVVALLAGPSFSDARRVNNDCSNAHVQPADLTVDEAQDAILCLLNKRRAAAGLRSLDHNNKLQTAAARHNSHMLKHNCFAHQCSGEASMTTRIKNTGYLSGAMSWQVGENIAWGEESLATPAAIVDAWMKSPGHRANILNGSYDEIGISADGGRPGEARHNNAATFTTDFGRTSG
jgi:uncharacterized protein YkwD